MSLSEFVGKLQRFLRNPVPYFGVIRRWLGVRKFYLTNRLRYWQILQRIRAKPRNEKIRVVFVVDSIAKWKTQSLYDAMIKTGVFEPVVFVTITKDPCYFGHIDISIELEKYKAFFDKLGCKTIVGYDAADGKPTPISELNPDIVFFQEPTSFCGLEGQTVSEVMKYALCCYVPYSIEFEGVKFLYTLPDYHLLLFLNIAWCQGRRDYLRSIMPWWSRSGVIKALGHTIFDGFKFCNKSSESKTVIYAPHFSFPTEKVNRPLTISTFLWSGKPMLEYARCHREFNWVFKPHPRLRGELIENAGWPEADVDAYYKAWEEIGGTSFAADYEQLFNNSFAMITDSGSFLAEYPATGRPLIRLNLTESGLPVNKYMKPLLDTFYNVSNLDELQDVLEEVIEKGLDPKRDERVAELRKLNIIGVNAAENIVAYLRKLVRR